MWAAILQAAPLAMKVVKAIVEGARDGASNEEIRQRIASKDLILDKELDDLRSAKADLDDFITGG